MKIYLARHGESHANTLHEISNRGLRHGLTERGREQALDLARKLENESIWHIFSSRLLRAIETGIILANYLGIDYDVVDALREYDCGVLEGRSDEEAWRTWQRLYDAWTIHKRWEEKIDGGESFFDLQERFTEFVRGLVDRYGATEAHILCVSHGGVYRMMLPLLIKGLDTEEVAEKGFGYTSCLVAEWHPTGFHLVEWFS